MDVNVDVGDLDGDDSIQPEGAQRLCGVAPGLEIAVSLEHEDPQRVDQPPVVSALVATS